MLEFLFLMLSFFRMACPSLGGHSGAMNTASKVYPTLLKRFFQDAFLSFRPRPVEKGSMNLYKKPYLA